jgi:hypothetical protein
MNIQPGQSLSVDHRATEPASPALNDDPLMRLIKRRHPDYECRLAHWSFVEACYEGGREWFKDNIFRYMKEGDKEFKDRLTRAYRFNHTREVVDLVNKYLFKPEVARNEKDAPESVKSFWKKATRNGLSIKDLARQVGRLTSIKGRIGIVIDTNHRGGILSRAEQAERGVRIYAYTVNPEQLLDYGWDDEGNLSWLLIQEAHRDDDDPFTSTGEVTNRYRLWTKQDWTLYEIQEEGNVEKVVEIATGEHGLGLVPVVLADHIISDEVYSSQSMIDDIAYLDRAVANYLSNLDAIIQDQTFSQLAMPAQGVLPGEDAYTKLLDMGTKRIFLYDGESNSAPFYLSPDVKQAELILSVINKVINEIYHTVGLAGERTKDDNAQGIDNSSGVAKLVDFERVNALLTSKADSLELVENKIASIVAAWAGEKVKDDLVSYPDTFDVRGLYEEFDISTRLMLVDAPKSVRQEQMKSVLDKLFPQLAADLRKKMENEIKNWPADPLEAAGNLPGGGSYGSQTVRRTGSRDAARESLSGGGKTSAK